MRGTKKRMMVLLVSLAALLAGIVLVCNLLVIIRAQGRTYERVEDIPTRHYGLLLGTTPESRYGGINTFFVHRIEAASRLYHAGKVKEIVVSGDECSLNGVNEVEAMQEALIKEGVPQPCITLDVKGFSTIESIRNTRQMGIDECIVISQEFHNERAIYLADHYGLRTIGFNAERSTSKYALITYLREILARVKVFVDIMSSLHEVK